MHVLDILNFPAIFWHFTLGVTFEIEGMAIIGTLEAEEGTLEHWMGRGGGGGEHGERQRRR